MLDKTVRFRLIGVVLMVGLSAGVLPVILDGERPPELDVNIQVESAPLIQSVQIPPLQPITSLGDNSVVEENSTSTATANPVPSQEQSQKVIPSTSVANVDDVKSAEKNEVKQTAKSSSVIQAPQIKKQQVSPLNGVRWSVQIATFKSKSNADNLVKKLIKADYAAYSITTNSLYKVYVGPEIDREKAESYKDKIEDEFRLKGFIVKYSEN